MPNRQEPVHPLQSFSNYLNAFIQYFELRAISLQEESLCFKYGLGWKKRR
jgi:hypothetical protein